MERLNLMAIRISILCITMLLFYEPIVAYPCSRYTFEFFDRPVTAISGDLTVSWKINTGFNRCTDNPDEILGKEFVITIESIYENLLLTDTVKQNHYRFPSSLGGDNVFFVFKMRELGEKYASYTMGIRIMRDQTSEKMNRVDSLNHFLINGYFLNATTILCKFNDEKLFADVASEYDKLFPERHPYEQDFFNSYLDSVSMTLKQMPFVHGMKSFLKKINKLTKSEFLKSNGFDVMATVSKDGSLKAYKVTPADYTDEFDKAKELLSFTNNDSKDQPLLISIGKTKNERKYKIKNSRALLDPNSKHFRKKFRYWGPVQ